MEMLQKKHAQELFYIYRKCSQKKKKKNQTRVIQMCPFINM